MTKISIITNESDSGSEYNVFRSIIREHIFVEHWKLSKLSDHSCFYFISQTDAAIEDRKGAIFDVSICEMK